MSNTQLKEKNIMFKAFNQDLTCLGFQYKVGKTYNIEEGTTLEMCKNGFHGCSIPLDCLQYYNSKTSRFCEVSFGDEYITYEDKTVVSQITIVREIIGDELKRLLTGTVVRDNGDRYWYKNGQLHRDGDQPSKIDANGGQYWYKNGLRHRDGDQPAMVCSNGDQCWYKNGLLHRDGDLPAIVRANGDTCWYRMINYRAVVD